MARHADVKIIKKNFGGEEIDCIYTQMRLPATREEIDAMPVEERENYDTLPALNQHEYLADDGIICMQDVAVKTRDGETMYVDIYRPITTEKVPVIISWSFYGKRPFEGQAEWKIHGVPGSAVSNMSKYESPDPGYWCHYGFAVANVDPRGVGHSTGEFTMFGTQEGQDGYDFIEWVAQQPWCNGKVGMAGNSCVAMTQIRIAAQQPPHLAAIAPWECTTDQLRESLGEGGIPATSFIKMVFAEAVGTGYMDNMAMMYAKYPDMNGYWLDKIPDFKAIKIPVYMTACWNHFHLRGSFNTFRKIRSTRKWLRVHREFEWPDSYTPENLDDLRRFFERYLKNIYNGWEMTPRYRLEVQDCYEFNAQKNRPEKEFPLARTQYRKLYLDASDMSMKPAPVETVAEAGYDSENKGCVNFDYYFDEDTEITGYMKLHAWVEARDYNDGDLFITVKKLSTTGEWLPMSVLGEPHPGAWGKMRISRRDLDPKLSTDYQPVQSHKKVEKVQPGEIVPVDIEIVPHSRLWHKGQAIRVEIAGTYLRDENWIEPLTWDTDNHGQHVVHTGGQYDSYLQIPVIPPRFQDGDIIIR